MGSTFLHSAAEAKAQHGLELRVQAETINVWDSPQTQSIAAKNAYEPPRLTLETLHKAAYRFDEASKATARKGLNK